MTLAAAQAYLNPTGGETQNYVSPQDIKDAFSVIYTDLTATTEIQVTHPNTTDILVKAWDTTSSSFKQVYYDSGLRALTPNSPWNGTLRIRRVNDIVYFRASDMYGSSSPSTSWVTVADGFKFASDNNIYPFIGWEGSSLTGKPFYFHGYNGNIVNYKGQYFDATTWNSTKSVSMHGSWPTLDAIPTSLPGTAA